MIRVALLVAVVSIGAIAVAAPRPDLSDDAIFGADQAIPFHIQSVNVRFTHIDQDGRGYQSQADRRSIIDPGRETVRIEQPQLEVVATQGKLTHRLWVPVDIVTAASPDAVDTISHASRQQEAGSIEIDSHYQRDRRTDLGFRAAFHIEENFRSWLVGISGSRSFADDNTVLSMSLNQVVDWLDRYTYQGIRNGRAYRSTSNLNLGMTQLLSPTTIGALSYGGTLQLGELSNTWNASPLRSGALSDEELPHLRHRHAFVGRLAQSVPGIGMVVKLLYRYYIDSWHLQAHTIEASIYQHLTRSTYLRFNYRFHHQTAVSFWTSAAAIDAPYRTADSDLQLFSAQTFGGLIASDVATHSRVLKSLHIDFGYDHYQRTNGLWANLYTCALGFRF